MLVVIAVLAGGAILFPSLAALFGLVPRGGFDPSATADASGAGAGIAQGIVAAAGRGLLTRTAIAC